MKNEKSRYFTFILYPESIPEDWICALETLDVSIAISPLHDRDKSTLGGFKKAHWHVIYIAKNPVTAESVRIKIKRLLGDRSIAKVQIIEKGIESMYLYLTHESKDAIAKKKHVYSKDDIILLNNFDIDRYITLDVTDKKDIKNELIELIQKEHLVNISDLISYFHYHDTSIVKARSEKQIFEVVSDNTSFFRLCFDAQFQNGFRARWCERLDCATGELLSCDMSSNTSSEGSTMPLEVAQTTSSVE